MPSLSFLLRLGVLVASIAAVLSGCRGSDAPSPDDAVVATVGQGTITAGEFAETFARVVLQAGLDGDPQAAREAVLTSLVNRQLLVESALAEGIEGTEAYRAARDLAETKALVDAVLAREKAGALAVTEADLREQFVQAHTTYEARHLYARDRAAAERLRARLEAGETFEALARETFADPLLSQNGGFLGTFGHDEMDPAFEAAAFRLPVGEVSEPVRTATGYSVLRVEARATSPLLTEAEFARKRDDLERYVRKRKRTEARFDLSREVRDALAPQVDAEAFDRLVAFATGRAPALDAEALAQWRRTPLVRFTSDHLGEAWTVGEVEDRAAAMTERQRAAVQDAASLQEFIEGLLVREELAARARAAGLDRQAWVAESVDEQMEDWVFEEAKRRLRLVDDVPEDTLRAHFASHAELYGMPERVRAREILVATRPEADALLAQLRAGADFGDLARRHSLRPGAAQADGSLGPVSRDQLGRLGDAVFAAAPGDVV
ncbi:MAG: peptidylprolyl isomerase, partial [Bacteroidota bacterium]